MTSQTNRETIDVGINGRPLRKARATGVGRYTRCLLGGLSALRGQSDVSVTVTGAGRSERLPGGVESTGSAAPHSGLRAHLWEQFTLPRRVNDADFDVFHTPGGHPPVLSGTPLVTTIHDVSPIAHPEWFAPAYAALYRVLTPLAVRASARVIAVSAFAREEIVRRYPAASGKTVVIHNGVAERDACDRARPQALTSDEYLLFVGSSNPRKNLGRLLEGYRRYRRSTSDPPPLVLVGPERDVFATADLPPVAGVTRLGFVTESELAWLYENASLFAFPSLYEGFGLPILEAMRAGTPVLTSDVGAMAEVAGDAAHLVDPKAVGDIASGIRTLLEAEDVRRACIRKGIERARRFSWERTARRTVDLYREVARESE